MKNLLLLMLGFCALCSSCSRKPNPEDVAAQAAKAYYDLLIEGKYEQFVDGRYVPDSIPASYREQLIANAKMFMGEQETAHKGLKQVRVVNAKADTAGHMTQVFLLFVYGDNTSEEVLVPMVEHNGVWYTR